MKYIAISQPGGPEVLQIREGEIPTIGEHEVLIEVKAAGVNGRIFCSARVCIRCLRASPPCPASRWRAWLLRSARRSQRLRPAIAFAR